MTYVSCLPCHQIGPVVDPSVGTETILEEMKYASKPLPHILGEMSSHVVLMSVVLLTLPGI